MSRERNPSHGTAQDPDKAWNALRNRTVRMEALARIRGLLEWDQHTVMPPKGAAARGDQSATVAALHHEQLTDPAMGELLEVLEAHPLEDPVRRAGVRNVRRHYLRAIRLDADLVEHLERARVLAHAAWLQARQEQDFGLFRGAFERVVALTREAAAQLEDGHDHPYDTLLEEYEPGTTLAGLEPLLERLSRALGGFLEQVGDRPPPPAFEAHVPREVQERLYRRVLEAMGFDLEAGRLDASVHPFTTSLGPRDVRVTTWYRENRLLSGLYAVLHEGGHGLYEQGIPGSFAGTGVGHPASFGLHESQSRFWENFIGGSRPFTRWVVRQLRELMPGLEVTPEQLYAARCRVQPSPVRVEADEVTYDLHILVRFRLEVALLEGSVEPAHLEEAWNDAYERHLGLRPPDPVRGVLQDVHWAEGLFGYFPTYTLGNLYAASLGRTLAAELPDLWQDVERGEMRPILDWLRTRVHERGWLTDAPGLVRDAVGERDPVRDHLSRLGERHGRFYGVEPLVEERPEEDP